MIQLVFAYCETRNVKNDIEIAFGLRDSLPWSKIWEDFKNFKNRTMGTTLVMGANTFKTLDKKLPGRTHIVISSKRTATTRNGEKPDYYMTVPEVISYSSDKDISVIGGSNIIQEFKPIADKIIVTRIYKKHYVFSDVKLPVNFVRNIGLNLNLVETHFWRIDQLTDICETVYTK